MYHATGALFKHVFGTEEMRAVFSEERFVESFLETEAALARAEADVGLVPEVAAAEITEKATVEHIDLARVEALVKDLDLFTVAIITAWKEEIGEYGEFIHWGATSQDIADTAFMRTVREGYDLVMDDLHAVRDAMADLAETHADTPTIGRTNQVHALPMTFGLRVASWVDELDRGIERLEQLAPRLFCAQLFGAVGTLASLGEAGLDVQERFAKEVDLSMPDVAWFSARDRFAELLSAMAHVGGTLARVAREILVLNREETDEVNEPLPADVVGSSTMPHKRNPVKSQRTQGLAALLRGHAYSMSELQEGLDERELGFWLSEYALVPEAFLYLSAILRNARQTMTRLVVNEDRMAENLRLHGRLVTSEAVMMSLADELGRQTAHDVVHEHAAAVLDGDTTFRESLLNDDRVTDTLTPDELDALIDPMSYLGYSKTFVERAVED